MFSSKFRPAVVMCSLDGNIGSQDVIEFTAKTDLEEAGLCLATRKA